MKGDGVSAVYDTEGNFIGTSKEVELSEGLFGIDSNDYLDKQIRVKHLPASATKPDRIVLYQDTTLLASYPSHGAEKAVFSGNPADIESIAVFQQALMGHSMILSVTKAVKNRVSSQLNILSGMWERSYISVNTLMIPFIR